MNLRDAVHRASESNIRVLEHNPIGLNRSEGKGIPKGWMMGESTRIDDSGDSDAEALFA
jgi:hypothetical protein